MSLGNGVRLTFSLNDATFGLRTGLKKENKNVDEVELQAAAFSIKVAKENKDSSGGFILRF